MAKKTAVSRVKKKKPRDRVHTVAVHRPHWHVVFGEHDRPSHVHVQLDTREGKHVSVLHQGDSCVVAANDVEAAITAARAYMKGYQLGPVIAVRLFSELA